MCKVLGQMSSTREVPGIQCVPTPLGVEDWQWQDHAVVDRTRRIQVRPFQNLQGILGGDLTWNASCIGRLVPRIIIS
jgi:hypothetical protein